MNKTSIEWCRTYAADGSFEEGFSVNPVRFRPHGSERLVTMCQKVSAGCTHCYAEGIVRRFWPKEAAQPFPGYTALGVVSGEFVLDEKTLLSVLKRKRPARVFWGDMTDLFQESVPDEFLDRCFAVCALTPHLTHMFLTKRPERMLAYPYSSHSGSCLWIGIRQQIVALGYEDIGPVDRVLPNVWLGVSVEDQKTADARIPLLLRTPAAVRFLSAEPLLGPVDLERIVLKAAEFPERGQPPVSIRALTGWYGGFNRLDRTGLDWVIAGGESGKGARPMHPDWPRSLRDQCVAAGVPFFFKQWGEYAPIWEGAKLTDLWISPSGEFRGDYLIRGDACVRRVGKAAAGAVLDGREWREMPGSAGAVGRLAVAGGVEGAVGEAEIDLAGAVAAELAAERALDHDVDGGEGGAAGGDGSGAALASDDVVGGPDPALLVVEEAHPAILGEGEAKISTRGVRA